MNNKTATLAKPPGTMNNPFCEKLKALRSTRTVEELAGSAGVAASSVYKAEQTARVRWQTVEKIYGPLFRDDQELCETLILWALGQTSHKIALYTATETARAILNEEMSSQAAALATAMENLPAADQHLLLAFANKFRESAAIREMVRAWMTAMNER